MKDIKKCQGCGIVLQQENVNQAGYSQSLANDFCQRCYQLTHYGKLDTISLKAIDPYQVMDELFSQQGYFAYVIDLFHLEESIINNLAFRLQDKPLIIIATKRDILPLTMSAYKVERMIQSFLKQQQLKPEAIFILANYAKDGITALKNYLKTLKAPIYFFGNSNVGKSTLLNALSEKAHITTSPIAGTTLAILPVICDDLELYDTPGISLQDSWIYQIDSQVAKKMQPKKQIKPVTYQLQDNQALIIDGLGYLEFIQAKALSVTCYLPFALLIHRTKAENALVQFERISQHTGLIQLSAALQTRALKAALPLDIIIEQAGFLTIKGHCQAIKTHFKNNVTITTRKAIL